MKFPCSGIILAGGLNSRFSGENKAFAEVKGKKIIDNICDVFKDLFTEIIIVTNDPLKYVEWNFNIVTDLYPARSSLTGIHAGLFFSRTPYSFITACDTPFLKKELVEFLITNINPNIDVVLPETLQTSQPLCAVYSKQCIKPMKNSILKNNFKIQNVLKKLRVKKISENLLKKTDPDLLSFININTPEELFFYNNHE